MVKVAFGCSMRGGHEKISWEELSRFPAIIEELGHGLVSKHQTESGIIEKENKLSKTSIHDRDYNWLIEADVGIFEISNPSLGVGAEISDMAHLGKPVLCLFTRGLNNSVSYYLQGKQGSKHVKSFFECYAYKSLEDAKMKIKEFIESISKQR